MLRLNKPFVASLSALTLMSLGSVSVGANTIAGPTSWTVSGGNDSVWGIQFTALTNTMLTSFDFNHKDNSNPMNGDNGYRGTIELLDITTNTTPYSAPYGSFPSPAVVPFTGLNIALTAGDQYQLIDVSTGGMGFDEVYQYLSSNLPPLSYPNANSDISVTQGVFNNNPGFLENSAWAAFNNITTSAAAVPEPTSYALFISLGLTAALFLLRKRAL